MDERLDRLPGGFLAFTDDSIVRATNATLRAMLGYGPDEIEGKHVENLLTVPSRIFYQTHVFPLLKMKEHIEEVYLAALTKQGSELPVLINASRCVTDDGTINECLLIPMRKRNEYEDELLRAKKTAEQATEARDRMHQELEKTHEELLDRQELLKIRNAELEALRSNLELRVEQRTAELTHLVTELQGLNYSMAHDLRAPLRAIVTSSALLTSDDESLDQDEQSFLLERQRINAKKLASLVDDLLQLSRIGLQPLDMKDVDLSRLAREAMTVALAGQERTNIDVRIQDGIQAEGDASLLYLLIQNLIENAVKYSPDGGEVSFGVALSQGQLAAYVRDEGIGIDPQFSRSIFKPFHRLHRDDDFPGNGIGLANAERIVRRHGGSLWFESVLGRGSTFFFSLPGLKLVPDATSLKSSQTI